MEDFFQNGGILQKWRNPPFWEVKMEDSSRNGGFAIGYNGQGIESRSSPSVKRISIILIEHAAEFFYISFSFASFASSFFLGKRVGGFVKILFGTT